MNGKDTIILMLLVIIGAIFALLVILAHEISALFGLGFCIIFVAIYLGYMEVRQDREDRDLRLHQQTIDNYLRKRKARQMIPSSIHRELDAEREYQLSKGNDGDFDDQNTISDWSAYINTYLGRAVTTGFSESRKNMVKVATLACAALEAWDRNKGFPPRHFDEVFVFPPKGSPVPDHIEQR